MIEPFQLLNRQREARRLAEINQRIQRLTKQMAELEAKVTELTSVSMELSNGSS